ncbi:hypothetical protein N7U66_12860 [Lacinutrix neustonica]|uniref:Uncharacterized protein n=1 Tax=Lacinutrix neustonica TaxID=2980107 RepID=A0A9E8MT98_9FLAO|nr:hypothetical protein [Lacinutrix neustonica]WAC01063.1 hypothetical protein N7U66_12860 [Lacinutrix neustonica]
MSKELPSNKNNNEEVDLIVFFNLIGNAFSKLFDFIALLFKGLFKILISILSHFHKRIFWYIGAAIIGLAIGLFLDGSSEKSYGANMFIETNYNSGYQVYENIKNLNELASVDKDAEELSKMLGLKVSEASSITAFYIKPETDPSENMKMFVEFKKELDSTAREELEYESFILRVSKFNFKRHQIGVASTDKKIYSKLNNVLPKVLSENPYLRRAKEVGQENYRREEKTLAAQQKKIDSLVRVYLQIRSDQSNKPATPGAGTNLYLGNAQKNELLVNEAELLNEILEVEEMRREVISNMIKEENIISVISDFPTSVTI